MTTSINPVKEKRRALWESWYARNRVALLARRRPKKAAAYRERMSTPGARLSKNEAARAAQEKYRKARPLKYLLTHAKRRANSRKIEFSITLDDLILPATCPLLGISIDSYGPLEGRPSIDRIDSKKGYIPGNVMIVSHKANRLKNNATSAELLLLGENLKKIEESK